MSDLNDAWRAAIESGDPVAIDRASRLAYFEFYEALVRNGFDPVAVTAMDKLFALSLAVMADSAVRDRLSIRCCDFTATCKRARKVKKA